MARNIANFIINNNLDGVDIDWEYPAAPDIPGIPSADPVEGGNYLDFLTALRNLLPKDKTVSFAAPASFWYLQRFPIAHIMKVVDYVIYMTYDLHGQVSIEPYLPLYQCTTNALGPRYSGITEMRGATPDAPGATASVPTSI